MFVCNFLLIKSSLWSTNVFFCFCFFVHKEMQSQMEASKLIEFDIQFSTVSFKILFCFYLRINKHTWTIKGAWTLLGFWAVDKSGRTELSQEMACFPFEEPVFSVICLINPRVSCYCTPPAIWLSRQNPAGHSPTQYVWPDIQKAVGCLPVERQILHIKVSLKPIGGHSAWS